MKKPLAAWVVRMATTMLVAMPKAATRLNNPLINPSEPANSARIARNANTAGMCMVPVKKFIVPPKP